MTTMEPTGRSLEDLLAELLERHDREGAGVVDEFCRRHPEHGAALRRAVSGLVHAGLAGSSSAGGSGTARQPRAAPARLDDFEVVREIGRGGMGVVFEARQLSLRRPVALKVLAGHLGLDEPTIERFRREGLATAKLRHRNIVQVFAVGASDDHHYYAMELVDGASLDAIVAALRRRAPSAAQLTGADLGAVVSALARGDVEAARSREQDASRRPSGVASAPGSRAGSSESSAEDPFAGAYERCAVRLLAQIADGLECAHQAGVVHRDVKPSNVLVRPDGTALLTDFGLARLGDLPGLTRSGAFAGTPHYTAPEQARSSRAVDARADVFALGATLYELLTLRRAFDGTSSHEVLRDIQTREPIDPMRLNPRVPGDLAAVLGKALEKEPERRYASAAAFAQDLRAWLRHQPVSARRASPPARVLRWMRREPLRAGLVVALALGVPTVAALVSYLVASRPLLDLAAEETRRRAVEEALLRGSLLGDDPTAALAELRAGLRVAPDDVDLIAATARALAASGDVDAALAWVEARRHVLGDATGRVRVACLLAGRRDAEASVEEAGLAEPSAPLELVLESLNLVARATRSHDFVAFRRAQSLLVGATLASPRPRAHVLFALATTTTYTHDTELARSVATAFAELFPVSPFVLEAMGVALSEFDVDGAIAAFEQALVSRPDSPSLLLHLAGALDDKGDHARALELCRRIPDGDPLWSAAQYQIGRIEFGRGDLDAAEHAWRNAIARDPGDIASVMGLGNVLARRGDHDGVIALLEPVTRAFPRIARAHNNLASAWIDKGEFRTALPILAAAIAADPKYSYAHATRGTALAALGELEAARTAYEDAVRVDPGNAGRWFDLAEFLVGDALPAEHRDTKAAVRAARRSVELARGVFITRLVLGKALLLDGQRDAARAELESLLESVGEPGERGDTRRAEVEALLARLR